MTDAVNKVKSSINVTNVSTAMNLSMSTITCLLKQSHFEKFFLDTADIVVGTMEEEEEWRKKPLFERLK